jgi:hypothetical protein
MKKMLLAMLCLHAAAYAQTYSYNKIITTRYGNDNFSFDHGYCLNVSGGNIELKEDTLYIDNKKYILKPKKAEHIYKSKKCRFEFIYRYHQLAAIRQFRYDEITDYMIDNTALTSAAVR